jgi:hypothetical protein
MPLLSPAGHRVLAYRARVSCCASIASSKLRTLLIGICDLDAAYAGASEPKVKAKLAVEIRLQDAALARLLKQVKTGVPQPESLTTLKARRAVNIRWERVPNAGA